MNTNDTLLQGHLSYTCVRLGDFHLSYESSIWFCAVCPLLNSLCKIRAHTDFSEEHLPEICFKRKSYKN